jgi:hypothetical protein
LDDSRSLLLGSVLGTLSLFAIFYYTPRTFRVSADISSLISYFGAPCVMIAWQYFGFRKLELWIAGQGEAYVALRIFWALELGIWYYSEYESLSPAQHRQIKDLFAIRIQRMASAWFTVYREAKSTSFFKSQVRLQAKHSRNDIMTLVPGLVTASRQDVSAATTDLARLLIRTQTGYWYQTDDIARQGTRIPRRYTAGVWLASVVRETAVQVGMIAAFATIVAAVVAVFAH